MKLEMILAVDKNFAIGKDGDMLIYIDEDLHRFKKFTLENVIIMGRKTFMSLPGQRALPGRINIVITRDENFKKEDVIVVHSEEELEIELKKYEDKKIFVIGGGQIVRLLFDKINRAYLTMIDHSFEKYDTTIPNLNEMEDWKVVEESEEKFQDEIKYKYVTFEKIEK